ncbi:hypothetical protein F4703DRAFT_1918941 [Phycomyces blakesleeanus]
MSRKFTRLLSGCASYLGRDYKCLIQILPVILVIKFTGNPVLKNITPCFIQLGQLCSLVFVRAIESGLETYIHEVDTAVKGLIKQLLVYDKNCELNRHNPYTSKLKAHLLTHLPDNIRRFGTPLHFETEKGEQFNKHIREHLFHTNKLNTSKDIGLKFAKQTMMRHILDGGSWPVENGLRLSRGKGIKTYIDYTASVHKFWNVLFGGSREFADNNDDGSIVNSELCDDTFALFMPMHGGSQTVHPIIEKVSSSQVIHLHIDLPTDIAQKNNYLLAREYSGMSTLLEELKMIRILDMYTKVGDAYVINLTFSRNTRSTLAKTFNPRLSQKSFDYLIFGCEIPYTV